MDQILINDLLARGVIGITDQERSQPQDILFNLVIFTDTGSAATSDNIEDTVNYRTISKMILSHVALTARHTVEALAEDIAHLCLDIDGVLRVRVRVEKPGAVRFARSVGVEIERLRT